MPSFVTNPQQTQLVTLYPGNHIALVNNAATDTGITRTMQVAIGPDPMGNYRVVITNSTNQTATPTVAPNDSVLISPAAASYEPYSDEAQAITVAAGTSESFNCFGPWLSFTFGTAPTSGSLILSR
jgi:hypothetical protein